MLLSIQKFIKINKKDNFVEIAQRENLVRYSLFHWLLPDLNDNFFIDFIPRSS